MSPFFPIRQTLRKLEQLEAGLKNQHDINLEEAIVLCCLSQHCKCQGDVAGETGLTPTQASRILSRLESKGLVQRSIGQDDKRQMIFTISSLGLEKLQAVTPLGEAFLDNEQIGKLAN